MPEPAARARPTAALLLGHGSRDAAANAELEAFVAAYRAARPDLEVAHAYVELAAPSLAEALAELAARAETVAVIPLFLFSAGHVKNDVPLALAAARRAHPGTRFVAARALGVDPALVDLAGARAHDATGAPPGPRTALVVAGRGSSDPDANGDFVKLVRLLGEGRDLGWAVPCFLGIARPLVEDTLELVARARPEEIVVVPYLLFAGRLVSRLRDQVAAFGARYPWIRVTLAPHLGGDPRLHAVLDARLAGALEGERPLPCDTCQYRVPVAGVAGQVGGLQALLWSVRHAFTHTQAMPHVHAHRPLARHVLVCGNADCAARGGVALAGALRRLLKAAGRDREVLVTRTGCMGRCGEGPTVAVYPDGVWYRGVGVEDAEELVREHLAPEGRVARLVARLVDQVMQ